MAILFGTESIRYRMEKPIVNPQRQFPRRKLATPRTQLDRSQWIEGAIDLIAGDGVNGLRVAVATLGDQATLQLGASNTILWQRLRSLDAAPLMQHFH